MTGQALTAESIQMQQATRAMKSGATPRIASVCTLFPSQRSAEAGVFVHRRLAAMSRIAALRAVRPVPWFPVVRPFARADHSRQNGFPIEDRKMFYIPAILKHLDSMWLARCVEPALSKLHRDGNLDVIDAHFGFPDGVGCYVVGQKLGVPVFITMRGVEQDEIRDKRIGPLMVEALSNCAGVIAVSESLRQAAINRGVPSEQIRVIANATDGETFQPGDRTAARHALGLSLDRKLIVSVGFLNERKGPHRLIPAFAECVKSVPEAELLLVGEGTYNEPSYVNRLHAQVESLGLKEQVRFVGAVAPGEVGRWLQAADCFALATRREGRCNAVMEALACGLPVVTTPAGDNVQMVRPPQFGRIVEPDDATAMGSALVDVLRRDWDRTAISHSVGQRTWDDVARETLEFMVERLARR